MVRRVYFVVGKITISLTFMLVNLTYKFYILYQSLSFPTNLNITTSGSLQIFELYKFWNPINSGTLKFFLSPSKITNVRTIWDSEITHSAIKFSLSIFML